MKPHIPLGLRIAWRYLFSKKRHTAVNLISAISVAGVAVASAAVIIALSVFNGFSELAAGRFSLMSAPVEIRAESGGAIFNADSIVNLVSSLQEVGDAMPLLRSKAYAKADGGQMAVEVIGAPASWVDRSGIGAAIIDGGAVAADTLDATMAIVSVGAAINAGVRPSDDMQLILPRKRPRLNPGNIMGNFRVDTVCVAGVSRTGDDRLDAAMIILPIGRLRTLLSADTAAATSVAVYPDGTAISPEALASIVACVLPAGYEALTVERQNPQQFRMIQIEKWVTFTLLSFILLIASFNILSTLVMLMIEKRDNMRILQSMGMSRQATRRIFIWEGVLVSGAGCLAGSIAGIILVACQQQWGWIKLSAAGVDQSLLSISSYPVALSAADIAAALVLAVVTSVIASTVAVFVDRH